MHSGWNGSSGLLAILDISGNAPVKIMMTLYILDLVSYHFSVKFFDKLEMSQSYKTVPRALTALHNSVNKSRFLIASL